MWKWGRGKAFQIEEMASAKCPWQSIMGILEEVKGGQCGWSEMNK